MSVFRSSFFEALVLMMLATAAGGLRRFAPHGIAWPGQWPASSTSAEEAYRMMARPGDPEFASLQDVIRVVEEKSAALLDARSRDEFNTGHLPQARSLPFYEMEAFQEAALHRLAPESPLVIYCEGVGCELSFFLGRELQKQGYSQVRIFYGGYPEWKDAGLPVEK